MNPHQEEAHLILDSISSDIKDSLKTLKQADLLFVSQVQYDSFKDHENAFLAPVDESLKKEINHSIIEELKSFANLNYKGKSIANHLTVDGLHFWYYQRFRVYFSVRNDFYFIRHIEQLLEKYSVIHLYGASTGVQNYFNDNSRILISSTAIKARKGGINYRAIFKYFLFGGIRSFSGIFRIGKTKRSSHLILTHFRQYPHIKSGDISENDFLGTLLNRDDVKDTAIIDILPPPKLKGEEVRPSLKNILHREGYTKIGSEYILYRYGFLRPKHWMQFRRNNKLLKTLGNDIQLDNKLHQAFINAFKSVRLSNSIFYFEYLAYRRFFEKSSLKSITAIDENSPNVKLILDAAKMASIKTIGIQHGAIHVLHPAYMYQNEELNYSPMPDYTLVWGDYYKSLITQKGNYKPSSVHTIGQLKSDGIFAKNVKPEDFVSVFKKTYSNYVVFASQPQRDALLRRRAIDDVLEATKSLEDTLTIIKIHPNEKKEYYQKIIVETGSDAIVIKREIDLYELLSITNTLITCFSTVGAEAVFLNVPLVILDHLQQDIQGYHKEGVAFQVSNSQELKSTLLGIKNGDLEIDEENYKNFQKSYALAYDGKVGDRYFEFLRNTFKV